MTREPHSYFALPFHPKSFALISPLSAEDVKRAVLFIHGFNGSARGTWTDFLSLVDHQGAGDWWKDSDLFFLNYQWESVFSQLINNTLTVYKFFRAVFPAPHRALGTDNPFRTPDFNYRDLLLVGHSEGGLLLRKAMVEAAQHDPVVQPLLRSAQAANFSKPAPSGILAARMRLFAPALGGEMLTGLIGIIATLPVISNFLVSSAAKVGMSPASAAVTEARRQTVRYAEITGYECFSAHILWAEKDRIIHAEKYEHDLQCINFPPGTNHVSVCKPTLKYPLPLDFVEAGVEHNACR
jgi:hypothetical protein